MEVQASVTLYLLGYGIGQLALGTLSDSLGRRPILLAGAFVYTLACIESVRASTIHLFLMSRLVQGIAIAVPGIAAKACLSDCFSGKALQKASTYVGIAWSGGPILAPVVGGYLQHYLGWHACFYFLAGYSFLILIVSFIFLPETKKYKEAFYIKAIYLNYSKVLKHPVFIGCIICSCVIYSLMALFNVMGPFIIQDSLHYSAIEFGHVAFLLGATWFVGSLLNRLFLTFFDARAILISGLIIMVIITGCASLIMTKLPFGLTTVVTPLLLIYLAGGLIQPCSFAISPSLFPNLGGIVNAISGVCIMLLTSLITLLASQFTTHTQMPLIYLYFSMSLFAFLVYRCLMRSH
ncbi:MAG TPA: hypothetical protein DCL40_04160 [Coxiellaceae bacterium]|nr:hypothetical protein [Coxiellaceae bacterium]